jgi:ubiquinone/menaquinone biosynthesis C-methylase UbiE
MTTRSLAGDAGMAEAYRAKAASYFSNARVDFVARLPEDDQARILEVGCGTGATGALAMARGRAGFCAGIELTEHAASLARVVLDEVLVGDVERMELPWQPAFFDALIMSEVLEHLIDPWKALERLSRVVRPGGLVLASSPNVSHWRVLRELARGNFPQADQGVFDRTHMRWFTPDTFAEMFERAGFRVVRLAPVVPFAPRTRLLSQLTGGRFDHLFMAQISIEAVRR